MRATSILRTFVVLSAVPTAGCGTTTRVDAVVESDEPFMIPGVAEGVCLARMRVRTHFEQLAGDPTRSFPIQVVVAPEDARVHVGERSFPVEQSHDADHAMRKSSGWSYDAYDYWWRADDEQRAPPPEVLLRMARIGSRSGGYDGLLMAVCDGNPSCRSSGTRWDTRGLKSVRLTVDVIPCGHPFQYAGPIPE